MKLATLNDGSRDGKLVVVARDNQTMVAADGIASTLQAALESWDEVSPKLESLSAKLNAGELSGEAVDTSKLHSPLPRAYEWIDGSAFLNHVRLVRKARNAEPPATLETDPLVYQGGSGVFLAPTEDIIAHDDAWGLDFESEIAVILGDTPLGTSAEQAGKYVRLVMAVNDVSLRGLIPTELRKGFGFVTSKPATAFSPFAVTPDELGESWKDGRLFLNVKSTLNDKVVGDIPAGPEMHFSFNQLIAHVAQTRSFTAGTILGSGTVSNEDRSDGISCLAEARMIEIIDTGAAKTEFMKAGDKVRIEVLDNDGHSVFGAIEQKVVAP